MAGAGRRLRVGHADRCGNDLECIVVSLEPNPKSVEEGFLAQQDWNVSINEYDRRFHGRALISHSNVNGSNKTVDRFHGNAHQGAWLTSVPVNGQRIRDSRWHRYLVCA
jgi:hypothetical protein